ncbi:MAG: regulatory protein RecX [Candidatus Eremiobacteraeota bacterium]|nr:regulatory protein RecX [Candidatus Eremiobacteraeota bacterium]
MESPALAAAIRLLSGKRLTKAQLAAKLRDRGYEPASVEAAVATCEERRYVDDRTYAQLYVKSVLDRKPVGRMRLLHDLLRHGIEGDLAHQVIDEFEGDDVERIDRALAKLEAIRPQDGYEQLGRRLERQGFTAPQIAKVLRRRAQVRGAIPNFETLE